MLALALATRAELIITGDRDLLALQQFEGVPILDPARVVQQLTVGARGRPPATT